MDFAAPAPQGYSRNWGRPGRYLYRYEVTAHADDPSRRRVLDWVIDPFAREYGPGKMSSFTLDYQAYAWSVEEAAWQNWTRDCALPVASREGDPRGEAIRELGFKLGAGGFPRSVDLNGDARDKAPFQYIENHDHARFVNLFGRRGDGLWESGDREELHGQNGLAGAPPCKPYPVPGSA